MKHFTRHHLFAAFVAFVVVLSIVAGGCRKAPQATPAPHTTPHAQAAPIAHREFPLRFAALTDAANIYSLFQDNERLTLRGNDVDALEYEDAKAQATIYIPLRATGERSGKAVGYRKTNAREAVVSFDKRVLDVPLLIVEKRAYTAETNFERETGWNVDPARFDSDRIGIADISTARVQSKAKG